MKRFGEANGGKRIGQTHFVAAGNQVQSMLSWLNFMSGFTYLNKALRLPPTNLQDDFEGGLRASCRRWRSPWRRGSMSETGIRHWRSSRRRASLSASMPNFDAL